MPPTTPGLCLSHTLLCSSSQIYHPHLNFPKTSLGPPLGQTSSRTSTSLKQDLLARLQGFVLIRVQHQPNVLWPCQLLCLIPYWSFCSEFPHWPSSTYQSPTLPSRPKLHFICSITTFSPNQPSTVTPPLQVHSTLVRAMHLDLAPATFYFYQFLYTI